MADDDRPQRSRLKLLALLAFPVLLGGGRARCSFMTGDEEDDEEDRDENDDEDDAEDQDFS
ncbi:MAG: hypothetical protein K0S81_799 [Rhodospirillales bacterium]|jgi:hypothetical protein|nr:hypothetical protein [Rhodospirillales bacterium]